MQLAPSVIRPRPPVAGFCIVLSTGATAAALVVGIRAERPVRPPAAAAQRVCYLQLADVSDASVAACDRVVLVRGPAALCTRAPTVALRIACHAAAFERNLPLDHPALRAYTNPAPCAALPYGPAVAACTPPAQRVVTR